jgi:hypothetical protein
VPSKADVPIDAEAAVAPPVLQRRATPQQIRIINPSVKTANPGNSSRNQTGAMTSTVPAARNAIGQPVVSPQKFWGTQRPLPALQTPSKVSPPIIPGGPVVSRVSVANTTNRGSVNGATAIRPATGPSVIGGPAQARYGINGTTIQKRH